MDTRLARELIEFARLGSRDEKMLPFRQGKEIPRAAIAALALLPLRGLFRGARVSSRIQEFVYTLY